MYCGVPIRGDPEAFSVSHQVTCSLTQEVPLEHLLQLWNQNSVPATWHTHTDVVCTCNAASIITTCFVP